jgi:hypothetical protein
VIPNPENIPVIFRFAPIPKRTNPEIIPVILQFAPIPKRNMATNRATTGKMRSATRRALTKK